MDSIEKSMLLNEFFALCKSSKAEREQLLVKFDHMAEQLLNLNENIQMKQNEKQKLVIADSQKQTELL